MEYRQLGRTGEKIPVIGLGTWRMGGSWQPDRGDEKEAVEAIKYAVELGMTHIDTAEMYGAGQAERIVGEAARQVGRERVFIATKVLPENLRYDDLLRACEGSLRRLGTSYIDLYMIHWPNPRIPLKESMRAMEKLYKDGKVRHIGVSNFSIELLEEARSYLSVTDVVSNQVEYNLYNRSVERGLLDHCAREGVTIVAYTPLGRGRVAAEGSRGGRKGEVLLALSKKYGKTPAQVALNWVTWWEHVVAIPKAIRKEHLEENAGAAGWRLSREDYEYLSSAWI